jgi:NifB/MoaA-like Fe-S oxidoreductase
MAITRYTEAQLERMTAKQIKRAAVEVGCTGIYRLTKPEAIRYFMTWQRERDEEMASVDSMADPLTAVSGRFESTRMERPAPSAIQTNIQVSCGANSGVFDVVGRTVGEVQDFLREALNIDSSATPLINSRPVGRDYVLRASDTLEFLKPAGRKGC